MVKDNDNGTTDKGNSTLYCSFCGKSQHEVNKLIAGPTVFICNECVDLCTDIIKEESKSGIVKASPTQSMQWRRLELPSLVKPPDHLRAEMAMWKRSEC